MRIFLGIFASKWKLGAWECLWNICVKMKSVWGRILAGTSRGWDRDQCARLWGGGGGKPWSAADAATTSASSHRSQLCCSVCGGAVVPWRPACRATWAWWWWAARPGTLLPSTIIGRLMGNALPCGGGSSSRSSSPRGGLLRCSQQTTWQPDNLTSWQPDNLTIWQSRGQVSHIEDGQLPVWLFVCCQSGVKRWKNDSSWSNLDPQEWPWRGAFLQINCKLTVCELTCLKPLLLAISDIDHVDSSTTFATNQF